MATPKSVAKTSARTEVKIGISDSTHEINIECVSTQSEVISKVNEAIKSSAVLSLSDTKGRELEIAAEYFDDLLIVFHVMPTIYRRKRNG